MERVFSVEEIPNPYWAPPQPQAAAATGAVTAPGGGGGGGAGYEAGAMNRCSSEWYFQKFLEEAVLDSPGPVAGVGRAGGVGGAEAAESKPLGVAAAAAGGSSAVVDPLEYNAMLKQKLEKDLAAVAMWREPGLSDTVTTGYADQNFVHWVIFPKICKVMVNWIIEHSHLMKL